MFVQRRKNLIACNEIEWRNKKCQLFRQNLFGEVSHFLEVDSQLVLQHFSQLKQSRTREVPVLAVIYNAATSFSYPQETFDKNQRETFDKN